MVAEVSNKGIIQREQRLYSLEEYFEQEELANYKNEFINGKIIPMAGGTFNHNTISGTFYALLFMLFFDRDDISVHNSDQKIHLTKHNRVLYSDTCVIVGQKEMYQGGKQAILNPTLIVEVLSGSTEKKDRTSKFRLYQSLPSFKEYVLVHQDTPIVEVLVKIEENKWQMTTYIGLDKMVELETLGVALKMSDIYKKAEDLQDPQTVFDFPEEN